jgi:adenosylhomocysteine nucleosidase
MPRSPEATGPIAIDSAMHEELHALLAGLEPHSAKAGPRTIAGRHFHLGSMHGQPVVLVLSGIGKVAAATTAALLVHEFDVSALVFTGVAGGLADGVRVGDIVVATEALQHDMDASPLFARYEVPLTGRARFDADPLLSASLAASAQRCMAAADVAIGSGHLAAFGIASPRVHQGLIVSGDRFVSTATESRALAAALPDALAVEMEGAAVAQVCADFARPFAVLRTISDRADDDAHADFSRFIAEIASVYTRAVVHDWLAGG